MATVYTHNLMEQGEDFRSFALRCARAFGACVTMRDDDLSTPIPEKFEPSDYHVNALGEAVLQYERLSKLTTAEREAFGDAERQRQIATRQKWATEGREQDARLDAMAKQVEAWSPDPALGDMKGFMLEQIRISRNGHHWDGLVSEAEAKPAMQYYTDALAAAEREIVCHREEMQNEQERVDARNEWLRKLRASLPVG